MKIDVQPSQLTFLLSSTQARIEDINKEIEDPLRELQELRMLEKQLLEQLNSQASDELPLRYNTSWKWLDKIVYVMRRNKTLLTLSQIVTEIQDIDKIDRGTALKSISAILSIEINHNRNFIRQKNEKNEWAYALK